MPKQAKFLAWVDLETTGLDPEADPILEIGLIVTPARAPFDELAAYQGVIDPADNFSPVWHGRMNDVVRNMHTRNGLLADIYNGGFSMARVQAESIALLSQFGKPHDFMLAGSGVGHFDKRFIDAQMSRFASWLQYPVLDVGVLRRALVFAGRKDLDSFGTTFKNGPGGKPHRGIDDVRDHLAEWRLYADLFTTIPTPEV
jgi:oligoribonuclease